jgi:DNA recombination protein RmuC
VDAQNKNTREIIRLASSLYEKFHAVARSIEDIGKHIGKSEEAYQAAISQISTGKGNAISIVKKLEDCGIEKKKSGKKVAEFMQDVFDEEGAEDSSTSEVVSFDKKAS